jgi:hypothetical protein
MKCLILQALREWPEMTSCSKGGDDVTFFPFSEVSKKYKSDQNYVYNFSFPKMDDDRSKILKSK